jgi:hypothetical protein
VITMDNKRRDSFFDDDDDFYFKKPNERLPTQPNDDIAEIRPPSLAFSEYSDDFEDESTGDKDEKPETKNGGDHKQTSSKILPLVRSETIRQEDHQRLEKPAAKKPPVSPPMGRAHFRRKDPSPSPISSPAYSPSPTPSPVNSPPRRRAPPPKSNRPSVPVKKKPIAQPPKKAARKTQSPVAVGRTRAKKARSPSPTPSPIDEDGNRDRLPPIKGISGKDSLRRGQSLEYTVRLPPIHDAPHWNGVHTAPRNLWKIAKTKQRNVLWWMQRPSTQFQPKKSHPLLDKRRMSPPMKGNVIQMRAQGPSFNF